MQAAVHTIGQLVELPQSMKRLPPAAKSIVADLQIQRAEAAASGRVLEDQIAQLAQKRNELAQRRLEVTSRAVERLTDADPQVVKLEDDIADCREQTEQLRPRADRCHVIVANIDPLIQNLENWFKANKDEIRPAKPIVTPKLSKGETFDEAIEGRRRRRRELSANIERYRAAPLHSSVVLKAEIERINALAERGKPDAFNSIETGAALKWSLLRFSEFIPNKGRINFEVADTLAIMAHMFRPQMIEAAKAAIAEAADDAAALSDDQRAKLIAEAERDSLAVAREECALIRSARAANQVVHFRPDIDPRALLELE